uniref:SPOR domain-containing protein n=1 Tax=uncultured Halomonas sp. TaxID=173971 RepID=UPI00260485C4|nr:SPOR domain-containing protein [uncultured Halomonas sp.]
MKYGMRERLSGAIILIALGVIFVPMLFDEPAPREGRPEPSLSIDAPIDVERHDVAEPTPPASLAGTDSSEEVAEGEAAGEGASPRPDAAPSPGEPADPIADLAQAADQRQAEREAASSASSSAQAGGVEPAVESGDWAVQVGSFGEPANVERLLARLRDKGFSAYSRPRGNDLTTVYVGPFGSSEAGERAVAEVKASINLQGLLVRVKE